MNLIKILLRRFRGIYRVIKTITPVVGEILDIVYIAYNIVY